MSKLLKQFTQLFARNSSALEVFLNSRSLKTHADVDYWTRYYEGRGL